VGVNEEGKEEHDGDGSLVTGRVSTKKRQRLMGSGVEHEKVGAEVVTGSQKLE